MLQGYPNGGRPTIRYDPPHCPAGIYLLSAIVRMDFPSSNGKIKSVSWAASNFTSERGEKKKQCHRVRIRLCLKKTMLTGSRKKRNYAPLPSFPANKIPASHPVRILAPQRERKREGERGGDRNQSSNKRAYLFLFESLKEHKSMYTRQKRSE